MARQERCGDCLYWEHRAEAEVDMHTGYCTVHEMMKRDHQWCEQFKKRTRESEQKYMNQLYGEPPGDIDRALEPDLGFPEGMDRSDF